MTRVHLRFATDILKRFGEELNPNPDQGILELVKNAYDADAHYCHITLTDIESPGGTIEVSDDGDGMDDEDIENGWLVLGRSPKSASERTRLGRIPAGSKGLGRLAALRMGAVATLRTFPRNNPYKEYELAIDWSKFEQADVVEDVTLTLHSRTQSNLLNHGSVVTMSGVRSGLTRGDVKRLARGLLLLADPFGEDKIGFHPKLKAPEFVDLEKLVESKYFNDAEFHLEAVVDGKGRVSAKVTDFKGEELFSADHQEIRSESKDSYRCPPCKFDLWIFILSRDKFITRAATQDEVKVWLKEFGGVHIYVNGLRVAPYGNPGNDWLDMNLRRASHPEHVPSTNTSIGRISVTDLNDSLLQKTDRSGLIEGDAFHELREMAQQVLAWMARERMRAWQLIRTEDRIEAPKNVDDAKTQLTNALRRLAPAVREKVTRPFEAYERARDKEAQGLRKEVQLYRTLSTAGIAASVFAHESRNPIKLILQNTRQVVRRAREHLAKSYDSVLDKPLSRILRQSEMLSSFTNLTLSFIDHEKRRVGRVNVHDRITEVLKVFDTLLKERQVSVSLKLTSGNPYLRGTDAAMESILTNLIVNSLQAFETMPPGPRRIQISSEIQGSKLVLTVSDSGPGIKEISLKNIWLPGETTHANGTGLGLTIVHDSVRDLGGFVTAHAKSELGGAQFVVELPILGA